MCCPQMTNKQCFKYVYFSSGKILTKFIQPQQIGHTKHMSLFFIREWHDLNQDSYFLTEEVNFVTLIR